MSCQQVPTAPALKPYPRSVQVGEFEVAITGGVWVAIRVLVNFTRAASRESTYGRISLLNHGYVDVLHLSELK